MTKARITVRQSFAGYTFLNKERGVDLNLTKASLAAHDNDLSEVALNHESKGIRRGATLCIRIS